MGLAIESSTPPPIAVVAMLGASVRRATTADLPALARLINRAHVVEQSFAEGERTGPAELAAMAERGHFLVLDGRPGELAASVYVRVEDGRGWLSMLAVAPELQRRGLGHRLVAVVEALCAALGCAVVTLDVVNLREELTPFYRHLGYRAVGTAPFDHRPVRRACHLVRMEKALA